MAQGGDVGDEGLELDADPTGPGHNGFSLGGELPRGPIHQGGAQLPLEAGHMGRHVGLDGMEGVGGSREGAVVGHGHQGMELTQVHLRR